MVMDSWIAKACVSYLARREGRYYLQVRCNHLVAALLNQPLFRMPLRTADCRQARRRGAECLGWIYGMNDSIDFFVLFAKDVRQLQADLADRLPLTDDCLFARRCYEELKTSSVVHRHAISIPRFASPRPEGSAINPTRFNYKVFPRIEGSAAAFFAAVADLSFTTKRPWSTRAGGPRCYSEASQRCLFNLRPSSLASPLHEPGLALTRRVWNLSGGRA
jgi:hypothetical protein